MAINKVIDRNNNVLIDLSNDDVNDISVRKGVKFHDKTGNERIGILDIPEGVVDITKYRFYDYDGTLMYSFTDEEIDAMTELPAGADHTDDNLTFQEWNWTLEDLKTINRSSKKRPIVGANYITSDGKTYLNIDCDEGYVLKVIAYVGYKAVSGSNGEKYILNPNTTVNIDWGDGESSTYTLDNSSFGSKYTLSHTYNNRGNYDVVIDFIPGDPSLPCPSFISFYGTTNNIFFNNIKIGNLYGINFDYGSISADYVSVPCLKVWFSDFIWRGRYKFLTVPRDMVVNHGNSIGNGYTDPATSFVFTNTITSLPKRLPYNKENPLGISSSTQWKFGGDIYLDHGFFDSFYEFGKTFSNTSSWYIGRVHTSNNNASDFDYTKNSNFFEIPNFNNIESVFTSSMIFYIGTARDDMNIPCSSCDFNLQHNNASLYVLDSSSSSIKFKAVDFNLNINENCSFKQYNGKLISNPKITITIPKTAQISGLTFGLGTIDLTKNDFVPAISSMSLSNVRILVPADLLDQYKTAAYWSNYASRFVGI